MGHERLTHPSPIALSHEIKRKPKSSLLKKQIARIEKTPILSHKKQRMVLEIPVSQNQRKHLKLLDFKVSRIQRNHLSKTKNNLKRTSGFLRESLRNIENSQTAREFREKRLQGQALKSLLISLSSKHLKSLKKLKSLRESYSTSTILPLPLSSLMTPSSFVLASLALLSSLKGPAR